MEKRGRNDLCHCGSGRKFKKCHALKTDVQRQSRMLLLVVGGVLVAAVAIGVASFNSEVSTTRVWSAEHGHYHDASGREIP
jgi:hypothetical protein